ncbi:MAG TPA: HEPN-associated N-terminal domain-containing protein [Gaiellaceae bacterium]
MGFAKRWQMEQWERGFNYVADKYVCGDCVDDEPLRRYIRERTESTTCSYCEREAGEPIACELDLLLQAFADAIAVDWRDAIDQMPYDGDDWALPEANRHIYELLADGDLGVDVHPELFDDVVKAFSDRVFAPRYFFDVGPEDALNFSWDAFVDQVSHHTRYLFPLGLGMRAELAGLKVPPERMLSQIGTMARDHELVRSVPAGTVFARARLHERAEAARPASAAALGTPPSMFATRSNRMSPLGIPMFYGAVDEETVVAEATSSGWSVTHDLTIGWFETLRDLNLLDLSELPPIPSLFEPESLDVRPSVIFLHRFAREVNKPVAPDALEHIEYVPTQIVTEYFRHGFEPEFGVPIDGIRYRSAIRDGGVCVVLFVDNEQCVDDPESLVGVLLLIQAYSLLRPNH